MDGRLVEPILSDRPHGTRVESDARLIPGPLQELHDGMGGWFALDGALVADPVVNGQLFFVVEHEGKRHPHYGRFLVLEPTRKVELTWVTGKDGTQGAETVLSVDLEPRAGGCALTLTHCGFYDQERADHHGKSWEQILDGLDNRLAN